MKRRTQVEDDLPCLLRIRYDMQSNTTISQNLTTIARGAHNSNRNSDIIIHSDTIKSLAFSRNGTLLVTTFRLGLVSYDFANVDKVEEIGQPRCILSSVGTDWRGISSFSPDGTKIVVRFASAGTRSGFTIRIIDLQTGEIISERWDDTSLRAFVN